MSSPENEAAHGPNWQSEPEERGAADPINHEPRLLTRNSVVEHHPVHTDRLQLTDLATTSHIGDEISPTFRRGSRGARALRIALVTLLVLAAAIVIATTLWLRHSMRAALPVVDGTLHIAGLHATVTVDRNAEGVPCIHAASTDDLLFAQGFVTAQDRLWQMDALRRHAGGELAEILGPALIDHDKRQRYLQLRAAADRAAQNLPPGQLREMQAYAQGVNAFIESHRDRLPIEFRLLHYAPRPWTPRDSLLVSLVMWEDLTTSFPQKLARESLSHHLPAALLADMYPTGSWRDRPPTQPKPDLTTPRDIEEIPLDSTQSKLEAPAPARVSAHDLLAVASALAPQSCADCRAGSNNWAVSAARSASGAPLVSNDMHLGLSVPDIWYEAALHTPGDLSSPAIDVAGFTLPGIPWVLVGRNAHVAWGLTNLGADVQDVRIEHVRGSGPAMQYEGEDQTWSPVHHHLERIAVRAGHEVSVDVLTVSHPVGTSIMESPIITPLYPSEHRTLSLAWTLYDPSAVDNSFAAANAATNATALVAALADFGGPSLNAIYADDQGHIGYHAVGHIPIRGSAVPHPRASEEQIPQTAEPDSDEDDDQGEGASSQQHPASAAPSRFSASAAAPHLQTTLFLAGQAHARLLTTAYQHTRRAQRRPQHARSKHTPSRKIEAKQQPAAPPPPVMSFTIGSPISPVPVDALDQSQLWSGYIPYDQLPSVQDPSSGVLATANARVTPDDFPYALTLDWVDPYRAERIYRLLEGRTGITPHTMLTIQTDQHSEFDLALAQRLAYAIDHSTSKSRANDDTRLRQAADLLRTWDGEMSAGSPAAAITFAVNAELWPSLLTPKILAHDGGSRNNAAATAQLYSWEERDTALELLLQHSPSRWLPPGVSSWNDLLTSIVERALRNHGAPHDLAKWQYGSIHHIQISHPLFAGRPWLSWLLGVATGSGAHPIGGDSTTIDATGASFGPSERFTADLSDPTATLATITTGESGNPASPWYLDQFTPWLNGTSFRLALDSKPAEHTLTLVPDAR